jgi:thiamine pyrophosphate-dependent acetolactate synthase large subunit-like protein
MPDPAELTAAEAIVAALEAEGVDAIFGIPGVHNLPIYDALADRPKIRRITPRHEDGAALMANGYARASGRPGVCLAAAGPGVTNTITGLATAYGDSIPLLLIAAQIPSKSIGRELGELHDINDQLGIVRVVTSWATRIQDAPDAARSVHAAMAQLRGERPRPVSIETPIDLLSARGVPTTAGPFPIARQSADSAAIERVARLLESASSPAILVGGGAVDAAESVVELAERVGAPVLTTSMGLGIIPDDHPLCLGTGFDLQDAFIGTLAEADLVLAIGTRFTSYTTRGGKLRFSGRLVHVDIDPKEIGKFYAPDEALLGHAEVIVPHILEALGADRRRAGEPVRDLRAERQRRRDELREAFPLEVGLVESVRSAVPRDGLLALDMTGLSYWIRRVGIAYRPRTILYPLAYGGLGFGLPCAIGAQVAKPDRKVVAVCGDAGFQFSVQELATAVQLGQSFPIVIVNDGGYSALRPRQKRIFGRTVESDLKNPDFMQLARAYGADGVQVSPEELGPALAEALEADRMTILEVPVELRHPEAAASKISNQPVAIGGVR